MERLDEFIKIAEKAMLEHLRVEGGYGYEFYHGLRVMKLSKEIAESEELRTEKINKECLLVGALFHDVGRAINFDNHAEAGVEFIKKTFRICSTNKSQPQFRKSSGNTVRRGRKQ